MASLDSFSQHDIVKLTVKMLYARESRFHCQPGNSSNLYKQIKENACFKKIIFKNEFYINIFSIEIELNILIYIVILLCKAYFIPIHMD